MRGVVIALSVFVLLLALIACNAVCLNRTVGKIEKALLALTVEDEEALARLEDYWVKRRHSIELCVTFDEVRTMDELLIQLRAASESGSAEEFALARYLALAAAERLRRLECFSTDILL